MSRSLRIALFVGSFPVVSETFILRQIAGLLDLGHEVDIYADTRAEANAPVHSEVARYRLLERTTFMDMPPETAPWEMPVWPVARRTWLPGSETSVHNAVRLGRALPKFFRCLTHSPRLTLQVLSPREYRYQAASLSALYRLAALCPQKKKYDVLHAHFGPAGNSFRFARTLWQAPMIVSFHGYDYSTLPRKEGTDMYRRLFQTADAITVNSEYTGRQVEKLGCPAAKLHRLPVGLDPEEFPFRERTLHDGGPIRILTVARLIEIKGHEYVIRALAKVRERHPAICYDVVGDGPLRRNLGDLAARLGVQDRVVFHGALDSAGVRRLLAEAQLFVLASVNVAGDQEGQGLVLQEAQAAGLPVVATQHGGLPEGILPDQSGFLVAERDVDGLAERLNFLVEHPEIWPMMGRAGRRFVETRYDIRKLNSLLERIYFGTIGASEGRATFIETHQGNDHGCR
ncbi:MAG TPA: glycosyltransferase [Haliangiales bacterium]|nr:glycosyltransferase [Haliangiales bacterium]